MPRIGSSFDTSEPFLQEILGEIHRGQIQLPDFQRTWVWDDDHIRSLIASISQSFPIGVVMLIETGGEGARFKPRAVEGVLLDKAVSPERLILDGQQRLTALYQAIRSGRPVETRTEKGEKVSRVYYLDMAKCLDPEADRLEAVVSLPEDRVVRTDFARTVVTDVSTQDREFELGLVPTSLLFDAPRWNAWHDAFQRHFGFAREKMELVNGFGQEIWQRFQLYKVPVIEILKETEKEAVCHVFEKVNTGGVPLNAFELVTASYAADDFRLSDDWKDRQGRLRDHRIVEDFDGTDFLTAVTLVSTHSRNAGRGAAPTCKRRDILKLPLEEYRRLADRVERGLVSAARFLAREKVFDKRSLPYKTQLIPLSAICAVMGNGFEDEETKRSVARWYWCGVFGELYGGANETRYALDLQGVLGWLQGGDLPKTVKDSTFVPTRLLTLRTRGSAAYKGVMGRLMQAGSLDFVSGDPIELALYFDQAVDIHHVFPEDYCKRQGYEESRWNSIVNKAPLTSRTNRILGGQAPSRYLEAIEKKRKRTAGDLDRTLESHLINPTLLRSDDFEAFFRDRAGRLLELIERATGKEIQGRDSEEVRNAFGGTLVGV